MMQIEPRTITPDALRPGDVLLSLSLNPICKLIKTINKSDYSHAALYNGEVIVEAVFGGVIESSLEERIADEKYMDVYRFISDSGKTLGDPGWPAEPVIRRADYYKGQNYAYEELFFLLVLLRAQYGRISKTLWRAFVQRYMRIPELKEKFEAYIDCKEKEKEPVICSEMVYRCFAEATPDQKYKLSIQPWDRRFSKSDPFSLRATSGDDMPEQEIVAYPGAALALADDYYQKRKQAGVPSKSRKEKAGKLDPVLDLVTPRDLQCSKNLILVGRLERCKRRDKRRSGLHGLLHK
jgi:hypothetical protein